MTDLFGSYGIGEYGYGPYGGELFYPLFGLRAVVPINSTQVRVIYTDTFDSTYPPLTDPSNYVISSFLDVYSVVIDSPRSVILVTSPQSAISYTLTIGDARGFYGQPLDPTLVSSSFTGIASASTFYAVATGRTRVRAVFAEAMLQNVALTDVAHYSLVNLNNTTISILSVEIEQNPTQSVIITLGEDLEDEKQYRLRILSGIVTVSGKVISPDSYVFHWCENALNVTIPLDLFTGEVQGGLYGPHGGLVFFSPALETTTANSIIQVEDVSVCTKAYDEYSFPPVLDPPVLFTHGAGLIPTPNVTTLNSTAVLWAKFPRLMEATLNLDYHVEDTFSRPTDNSCSMTMVQPWDLDYVSLLNNTGWKLFDNAGEPPNYFCTANNLAPILPGPTTITVLQFDLTADSNLEPNAGVFWAALINPLGNSSLEADAIIT
jgi:hypothetical protein